MSLRDKVRSMYLGQDMSVEEIAELANLPVQDVEKMVKYYKKDKRSKGEAALLPLLMEIFPHQQILEQYNIENQFFDFYIPKLLLAIEYDGKQHFGAIEGHFDRKGKVASQYDFENRELLDIKKNANAVKSGIYVLRIPFTEKIDEQNIRRIINGSIEKVLDNLDRNATAYGLHIKSGL